MEHIRETAGKSLAQLTGTDGIPESDSDRCQLVWAGLIEMFGGAIEREYGLDPPALWVEAISSMADEDLQRAFHTLVREPRKFPPNLSEFVAAGQEKASSGVRYLGGPSSMYLPPPRDHKPLSVERRREHIKRIRQTLGLPEKRHE